jgi:hypothetical protein
MGGVGGWFNNSSDLRITIRRGQAGMRRRGRKLLTKVWNVCLSSLVTGQWDADGNAFAHKDTKRNVHLPHALGI